MDALDAIQGLEWLYLFVILVSAAMVHGTIGMGFPLVFTALGALVLDVKTAVFISLVPAILINLQCLTRGYHWRVLVSRFFVLAVCAALGSVVGTKILFIAPPDPVKLVLIASIVLYLARGRLGNQGFGWINSYPVASAVGFGLVAGIIGGITNAMGPVLVIYFLERDVGTDETVQGLNFCFLVGKIAQLVLFLDVNPSLDAGDMTQLGGITALVMAVLFIGTRIRQNFEVATYRRALKIALGVIACMLLAQVVV